MRLIINAVSDDFICAVKAAKWLIDHPEHKEALLVMSEAAMGCARTADATFYVKRTKSGISVTRTT